MSRPRPFTALQPARVSAASASAEIAIFRSMNSSRWSGSMSRLRPALKARCGELLVDLSEQTIEPSLGAAFGPRHEHVLRVRSAQQPPAVGRGHAHAVGAVHVGIGPLETRLDLLDRGELATLVD